MPNAKQNPAYRCPALHWRVCPLRWEGEGPLMEISQQTTLASFEQGGPEDMAGEILARLLPPKKVDDLLTLASGRDTFYFKATLTQVPGELRWRFMELRTEAETV